MKNNILAIAIPTYNRALILEANFSLMLPEIEKFSIPVYVSDDSNNKETEELIARIKTKYPYIFYSANNPSLGHDKNCIKTLSLPTEEYVWYLGDSIIIEQGGIECILKNIEKHQPSFLAVNHKTRGINLKDRLYVDKNFLLIELAWHLTMSGATIYSRNSLIDVKSLNLSKFVNFPQTALIFEEFKNENSTLYWCNKQIISTNTNKESYWNKSVFKVFITDWTNCVNNFDKQYSYKNKEIAIYSHSINTGLFSFGRFIRNRATDRFDLKEYLYYAKQLRKHSRVNFVFIFLISIFPKAILRLLLSIVDKKVID